MRATVWLLHVIRESPLVIITSHRSLCPYSRERTRRRGSDHASGDQSDIAPLLRGTADHPSSGREGRGWSSVLKLPRSPRKDNPNAECIEGCKERQFLPTVAFSFFHRKKKVDLSNMKISSATFLSEKLPWTCHIQKTERTPARLQVTLFFVWIESLYMLHFSCISLSQRSGQVLSGLRTRLVRIT